MEKTRKLAKECLDTALTQLQNSTQLKKERFKKIRDAEAMLLGKIKAKSRQQFNVPLPVLSGMFDTLCADLDDPVQVKVKNNPGKNLIAVRGINEAFTLERKSLRVGARWDYKDRVSRKYAITTSRAILKLYSTEDPYKSTLTAVNPFLFHCQGRLTQGAGILENHLFAGEEGVMKTKKMLEDGVEKGIYDKDGVELLIERAGDKDYQEKVAQEQEALNEHFKALNIDPEANNYVGETTFHLCEWVLTKYGERWYLLFDPWTKTWVRFEKLEDINPSGLYPWTSYTTHEDDQNFWSTSILADILYPIADSIVTLFNQDLTNRQKRNLNAKAYDREMFKNVAKLDEAQYRPDALVPFDSFGGTRKVQDGLYAFQTPEITGTIDLIGWLSDFTGKEAGVYQDAKAANPGQRGKTNNIVFAEIQQLAKRTDYRSHSYTECWGELMLRFIEGLKINLSDDEALDMLGPEVGFGFVNALNEIKLDKDDVQINSTKEQNQEDAMRKQQKSKSIDTIVGSEALMAHMNPQWILEKVLSDVGGWEKEEVDEALDLRGMGGEHTQFAMADQSIRKLLDGKEPEHYWAATISFQRKILDFERQHHVELHKKGLNIKFIKYVRDHSQTVAENMAQLALRLKQMNLDKAAGGNPAGGDQGGGGMPQGGAPMRQAAPGGAQPMQVGPKAPQGARPGPATVNLR